MKKQKDKKEKAAIIFYCLFIYRDLSQLSIMKDYREGMGIINEQPNFQLEMKCHASEIINHFFHLLYFTFQAFGG